MINNVSATQSSSNTTKGSTKNIPPKSGQKSLKELIAERRSKALKDLSITMADAEIKDPYEAVTNYKNFVEKKTAFIEQQSSNHYCLWDPKYPENPERAACSKRRLEALGLVERCEILKPMVFPEELILKKHTSELYELLKNTSRLSKAQLRKESSKWDSVYLTQDTFECAKLSVQAALTMTLSIARGDNKNGFALIRPPGHHAMANAFCGYCFLNNVAISTETAIAEGYAKKVLIVDFDVHHGQGVQQLFYNRKDVLYFSIHRFEHGTFWPNLRESDSNYIGEGPGRGYNVNVPLNNIGMGDSDYLAIVFNLLLPLAYEFNPDLILISAGYDAAIGCPEGQMTVTPHFYGHLISLLSGLANSRLAVCLEGGYFKESLAEGVACTVRALLGDACYPMDIHSNPVVDPTLQEVINNVKYFLHDYWDCFKCEELFEYPKQGTSLGYDEKDEHVTRIDFKHVDQEVAVYETADCYPSPSNEDVQKYFSIMKNLREAYARGRVYKNVIGYVYDDELLKHKSTGDTGKIPPEKPERLTEIMRFFQDFGLIERLKKIQCSLDAKPWLEKVHSSEYIRNILEQSNLSQKPDWYFNEHTGACMIKSVSCILSLAESISDGAIRAGVAIVRPPGHHASSSSGSGYCFVNNACIATEYLIQKKGHKRVLIVDFDIHHGNGTQELTYSRSDIMYISIHRFDKSKFFPTLPDADVSYTGEGVGKGYNINIPFNKGSKTDIDYWTVWHRLVLPIAFSYNPDFVIISAGFDAGIYDPLGGGYKVTPELFGQLVHTLKSLASGKILLALEGGYHVETTALSMTACVKALLGDPLPVPKFSESVTEDTLETVRSVVNTHRDKWPLLKVNKRLAKFYYTQGTKQRLEDLAKVAGNDHHVLDQIKEIINQCRTTY